MKALGKHILAEFFECEYHILNDASQIEIYMKRAALDCGATIVSSAFHTFSPHGVSGVVVIAESHLAIHTWPEYRYAAVDVFTCGETVDPAVAIQELQDYLKSAHAKTVIIPRGEFDHSVQFQPNIEMADPNP